jgi:hypothetical protein
MAIDAKQGSGTYHGYPAYRSRQGESILRSRVQRAIVIVGLTGLFIAAVIASLLR